MRLFRVRAHTFLVTIAARKRRASPLCTRPRWFRKLVSYTYIRQFLNAYDSNVISYFVNHFYNYPFTEIHCRYVTIIRSDPVKNNSSYRLKNILFTSLGRGISFPPAFNHIHRMYYRLKTIRCIDSVVVPELYIHCSSRF